MQALRIIEADASAAPALNGPRADLAAAIEARQAAKERAEAARAPLSRLDGLIAAEAAARAKVAAIAAALAAAVKAWALAELSDYARSGSGDITLAPNDDLTAAKLELAEAERLGDAARLARPTLEAESAGAFRDFRAAGDSVNEEIRAVLNATANVIRTEQLEHERLAADCVERMLALRAAFRSLQQPNESPPAAQIYLARVRPWTSVTRSRASVDPAKVSPALEAAAVAFVGRLGNDASATLEDVA